MIKKKSSEEAELSPAQIERLVDKLPLRAKLRLAKKLQKEARTQRWDNIVKEIDKRVKANPITEEEMAQEIKAVRKGRSESMNIKNFITCDPKICGGDPVFKNTRIPITLVLDLIEGGLSLKEIRADYYPALSSEAIKAALHYASEMIKANEFIPFNPIKA